MTYSCNDFSEDVVRCLVETHGVEDAAIHDADIGVQADAAIAAITAAGGARSAVRLIAAVIESWQSLDALAAELGVQTLADVLYLADALATGCTLVLPPERASFVAFVKSLPRNAEWSKRLRVRSV
jgi:hypothetical protein